MTRGLIFWVIMLVWLLFTGLVAGGFVAPVYIRFGALIEFVLFLLLGWEVYGAPVRGGKGD